MLHQLRSRHDQRKWKTRHALSYFYANMSTDDTTPAVQTAPAVLIVQTALVVPTVQTTPALPTAIPTAVPTAPLRRSAEQIISNLKNKVCREK